MADEIKKQFSGRKFITVAVISTYCLVIIASLILTFLKIMSIEVFLALQGGFGGMAMYIVKAYYDDKDRTQNGGVK